MHFYIVFTTWTALNTPIRKKKKIWSSPKPTRTIQYKLTTEMAVLVKDITYCYPFFPDSVKVIVWVFILVLLNPRKLYEFSD